MSLKKGLAALLLSGAMVFGTSGCATTKNISKGVLTPITITRDVIDLPLATMATFWNDVGESGKERFGQTTLFGGGGYYHGYGGGTGAEIDITYPVGKILGYTFGLVDYVSCRSLYPNFPNGKSPLKNESEKWGKFLFPNTQELWKAEKNPINNN